MISVYDGHEKGRVKIFCRVKDDKLAGIIVGNKAISHETGFQFYVDDYVAEQMHKCEINIDGITPKITIKDGEEMIIPTEEVKRQKEIKELEQRLHQLKAE